MGGPAGKTSADAKRRWVHQVLGVQVAKADGTGGKSACGSPLGFVPDLEIPSAPKGVIEVNETVILKLKIRNWNQAPKGIKLSWGEGTSGDTLDIESEHRDGEGSVKVTGLAAGEGTVRAEVKIGEGTAGRSYRFADTVFTVRGVPASAFVPDLDTPWLTRRGWLVGRRIDLIKSNIAPIPAIQALLAVPWKRTLQLWMLLTGKVATCRSFAPV